MELIKKIEPLFELIDDDGNIAMDSGDDSENTEKQRMELKQKALECVIIRMRVTTSDVAEYIKAPKVNPSFYTYKLLAELSNEGKINHKGKITIENMDKIIWLSE